jgi:hypothetical protein
MANPAVTYTFSNSTTADATQVNQNFTDLINSLTDATKSLSIDALTVGGAATLNGAVTLGNASSDDITITGSIAAAIALKTTNVVDLGSSTLGLKRAYFGNGTNSNTVAVLGGVTTSSYSLTLPVAAGNANDIVQTSGSGTLTFAPILRSAEDLQNISVTCSVAANALTIALKGHDGNDLSSTNRGYVTFRNVTATSGTPSTVELSAAESLAISSGSTLGHTSAVESFIFVYLINNAGTVSLAASTTRFDEGTVQSTTTEGGAGAADSASTMYSASALTSKAIRLIARLKSTQATAGTWATAPSEVSLVPFSGDNIVSATYSTDAGQSIANGSVVVVNFEDRTYDTHNAVTIGASWVFTVPVAGYYIVTAKVLFDDASFTTAPLDLYVYKNIGGADTQLAVLDTVDPIAAGTARISLNGSYTAIFAKGDTISIKVDHGESAARSLRAATTSNYVNITRVN